MEVGEVKFGEGTVLIVKGSESNSMSVLQQSVSESVQQGDSVTLNCTIHTETCAGEQCLLMVTFDSDSQMRILVLLSIIRTGVLLCCLTILIIIYTTRK
ncbi:unnamed protein product [Coregonus sp. 'balchen']|nr:unnamed protein product [Coregonus sp. 'balchen']